MIRRAFFIIGLIAAASSIALAIDKKAGTSGAQFLKIGAGARSTAMGDAFVAVADDVNSVVFNPAGLATISKPELTAMHTEYFQDINYDFGAFAYPTDMGAFAVSAATLKVEDLEKRALDESRQGSFEAMDAAYGLSFARNFGPLTSLGITSRYIKQEIDNVSAGTLSGDIGILRRLGHRPIKVALAVRHLGGDIKFRNEADPQPLTIDGGTSISLMRERLLLGLNIKKTRDDGLRFGLGTEYHLTMNQDFNVTVRGGYNSTRTNTEGASGLSAGAGLGFRQFAFDFAWVPFGDLGNTFRYSLHIKF